MTILAIGIQTALLYAYQALPFSIATIDSILSVFGWCIVGYYTYYVTDYIKIWTARLAIAIMLQTGWLLCVFFIFHMIGLESPEAMLYSAPFRFLIALLSWFLLFQWYIAESLKKEQKEKSDATKEIQKDVAVPIEEKIERLSVKDGSRIHIIHPEELLYIQACGDYVTLFTSEGHYLKEQTMKYFESHLGSGFVRIHRSCIVNMEQIQRIELFGKESYQVRLKNGTSLKASLAGYKLLKERLNL